MTNKEDNRACDCSAFMYGTTDHHVTCISRKKEPTTPHPLALIAFSTIIIPSMIVGAILTPIRYTFRAMCRFIVRQSLK